jgi:hypothetical protein
MHVVLKAIVNPTVELASDIVSWLSDQLEWQTKVARICH